MIVDQYENLIVVNYEKCLFTENLSLYYINSLENMYNADFVCKTDEAGCCLMRVRSDDGRI